MNGSRNLQVAFILTELVIGLMFGIIGAMIFIKFDHFGLFDSILLAYTSAFLSMFIGTNLAGLYFFKIDDRMKRYGLSVALSFACMILFIILYVILDTIFHFERYRNSTWLAILLPLAGAVLGSNFVFRKKE